MLYLLRNVGIGLWLGLLSLFVPNVAKATHIVAGEIYWDCLPTGEFVFYLKIYRDCNSMVQPLPNNPKLQIIDYPTAGNIFDMPLSLVSQTDITQPGCGFSCASPGQFGREEMLLSTAPTILNGTPPASGWPIVFNVCCRTFIDNIPNANNANLYIKAVIYPFQGQNLNPCFDSSPRFSEKPDINLCSGSTMRYSHGTVDPDGDVLTYEFAHLLGEGPTQLVYAAGYSPNVWLPGPTLDPTYNQVSIDPTRGDISYTAPASIQGRYNGGVRVTSWRCGVRIAETVRELFTQIIPCTGTNAAPVISPPVWATPSGLSGFSVNVQAGDLVTFSLTGTDADAGQTLTFNALGRQFGTNFGAGGCPNPPCATLTGVTPPYTGPGPVQTTFSWQTECQHIISNGSCENTSTTYDFTFLLNDDFCPGMGKSSTTVSITVNGPPLVASPQPRCASIQPNGDVVVSWAPSVDNTVPPSFSEYVIYHATNASGPFTQVGTNVGINNTSFTHTGASASPPSSIVPNYYFIRSRSGCGGLVLGPAIDTISTIRLQVANNGSTAGLSWNAPLSPMLPSSGLYQIYKESPLGTWNLLGTTSGLTYVDPVSVCNDQVNYQIQLPDALPCVSISNIDGDIFSDPSGPDPQPIDSVSVDMNTGLATVGWPPNTRPNTVEYEIKILRFDQVGGFYFWQPLVPRAVGYNNTFWTNPTSNAQNQSECYTMLGYSACGQPGTSAGAMHCTMHLTGSLDTCARAGVLNWNAYRQWDEGVKEYEILAISGTDTVKFGPTTDTTYTVPNLTAGGNYCFYVRAIKNSPTRVTSTSNSVCLFVYVSSRPQYQYFNLATVPDNSQVETHWFVDSTAGYIRFDVLRGTVADDLRKVGSVAFNPNSRFYTFNDLKAKPATTSYFYTVMGVDSCLMAADTMNMMRTVHLTAEAFDDRTNVIQWNPYEGFAGGVAAYRIYRSNDGPFIYQNIVPATTHTYTDDVEQIIVGQGRFCYYVEALEAMPTQVGPSDNFVSFQEISRSNEACALQRPNVFVPTAFTPGGLNPIFRPVTMFVDVSDFLFRVYDRWGMTVFETTDIAQGWDGMTMNGKEAAQGVYAYHVRYVSSKGDPFVRQGTVTLLRNNP